MSIKINKFSPIPLYLQLKDSIIEIIDSKTIRIIDFNKLYEIIR